MTDGLAKRFGLKPEQFGENLRDNYQRHDVDQEQISPLELAKDYCSRLLIERMLLRIKEVFCLRTVIRNKLVYPNLVISSS